jgi:hypothetical protein
MSDTRVWSSTLRGLVGIHEGLLTAGARSTSAWNLQKTLKKAGVYPVRDFPNLCTSDPPDAFFTYHSGQNFVDIEGIAQQTCNFAARELLRRRPEISSEDLNGFGADGIRLWIDYVFINQSARDIRSELDVLPYLLETVKAHFVLGQVSLTRAWCCCEIALFNQHCATTDSPVLKSFIAPTLDLHSGWADVKSNGTRGQNLYCRANFHQLSPWVRGLSSGNELRKRHRRAQHHRIVAVLHPCPLWTHSASKAGTRNTSRNSDERALLASPSVRSVFSVREKRTPSLSQGRDWH